MSLPVSQYEELLAEVRGLRRKAQRVQQLARPLIGSSSQHGRLDDSPLDYTMEFLKRHDRSNSPNYERAASDQDHLSSEDEFRLGIPKGRSTGQMSVSSEPVTRVTGQVPTESMYHGAWPNVTRTSMWNSEPTSLGQPGSGTPQHRKDSTHNDVGSVMSFASSSGGVPIERVLGSPEQKWASQQLEAKMDVVNSLLSMLGSQEHVDMGETLLALSTCPESCLAMRQSGCIPLLVQLVQSDKEGENRKKAAQALHNLVNSQPDEKIRKREVRILKLLEEVRRYVDCLKYGLHYEVGMVEGSSQPTDDDKHPVQTVAHLMKLSFDEGHRQAICQLGGIHTVAALVETEHSLHGSQSQEGHCILMRRYSCMALTNLTFGDSGNKTLLCSLKEFMKSLVAQLHSPSDELRQVTASVLRNLSWRADSTSKEILRETGSVTGLMKAAMLPNKENTLKSILSALWNLSAHCTENKSEICAVDGSLAFIVNMLTYKTPSKSLAIIENAGGILRNISSQIAVRDDYRAILRQHDCLHILLDQLKSPSLTIVSNACGTLWNLSAKNAQDQDALWQMGAPAMLRSLNHSKHKMIAMGSSAALKNLLSCRPQTSLTQKLDSTALALNLPELPTLGARKQKALMQDLDNSLSETCENIEKDSPVKTSNDSSADLTNAFASLNLNQPSTSYGLEMKMPKVAQNYGVSSLPYVPQLTRRTNPASFLPVRTKFTDRAYEDDPPEQPIDYSRKYLETKTATTKNIIQKDSKEDKFGSMEYTETDLDQPTDYSLRYAEDDSDSDICDKISKQEYVQDTVKTYCTEGTPYETPFVFSNATSMSDLRNVDEKPEINNDMPTTGSKDNKEIKNLEEKDRCSTEDISELEDTKRPKSEFSSGMMSPEKPVNYCEEGTPGCFSRVSSFGSGLDSLPTNQTVVKIEVKQEEHETNESNPLMKMGKTTSTPKSQNETKVVKFEQAVNYAEQTPLMFSRSSSLASLDSIDQHSIHDDRSSVVSDFSRLTSGIVSPSELPDSPTQTVPSSPRSSKQKLEFPSSSKLPRHLVDNKQRVKSSVFEDNVTKFKEESTPIQFSTATSLSSLTIDDRDDDNTNSTKTPTENRVVSGSSDCGPSEQQEKTDMDKEKEKESSDDLNDDSDGDEDILAACINEGMRSNISQATASSTLTKLPLSTFNYRRLPVQTPNVVVQDPTKTYCTEDTPAELSRVGSNSNLSTLTIPNDSKSKVSDFSDDSSNLSTENENILAECIQFGMPKPKTDFKGPPPLPKLLASRSSRNSEESVKMPPAYEYDRNDGRSASARIDMSRRKGRDIREAKFKEDRDRRRMCPASLPPYLAADEVARYEVEDSPYQYSLRSSLSDLTVDGSVAGPKTSAKAGRELQAGPSQKPSGGALLESQQLDRSRRRESFSSVSSLASEEGALLEECILTGMPTTLDKQEEETLLNECIQAGMPSGSSSNIRSESSFKPNTRISPLVERRPIVSNIDTKSKNVNAASVARNTAVLPQVNSHRPETSTTVAGVEEGPAQQKRNDITESPVSLDQWDPQVRVRTGTDTLQDRLSLSGETCSPDQTRNGSSESGNRFLEGSFEGDFTYSNSGNCAGLAFTKSCEESGNLADNRMLDPDAMIESLDRFTAELVSQASHLNKDKTSQLDKSKLSNNDDNSWTEMDTSRNEITFPTISGSSPNVVTFEDDSVKEDVVDRPSDDFSSINTTTMTESTLIAIEATKIATVLRQEAEMTHSCSSVRSLNLDSVRPPSQLNSLTNSAIATDKCPPKSPKLATRKRNLLVKRALSNSLNRASSRDSLENNSMEMSDCLEADNSISSVASLPREDLRNGRDNGPHPIFNVKQPFVSSGLNSLTADLEMVNPPSIFNDITDMCNSLADVPTEVIVTDTAVFEDCLTHVVDVDNTLQVDTSEFSDANSVTPIQTDISSAENSPKKLCKPSNKNMMSKQRRNVARDRYKTYVVAAEKVMQESIELENKERESEDDAESQTEGYITANGDRSEVIESTADGTLTYTVSKSRKERQSDSKAVERKVTETTSSGSPSPTRTKLSIRRNFIQKRLENRERFKTQTLNDSTFGSPELLSASPPTSDIHSLVEKEANLVLKTIRDSKLLHDEMLDSETLSLVSNDEDSEQIGIVKKLDSFRSGPIETPSPLCTPPIEPQEPESESNEEHSDEEKPVTKPKIVKPTETTEREVEEEPKGVRGRRKPLYSKTGLSNRVTPKTIKPAKTMAPSNLVKNVSSTFKSGAALKNVIETKPKVTTPSRPPASSQVKSSGYGLSRNSPGGNNAKTGTTSRNSSASSSPKHAASSTPPLERQGTFTKDDTPSKQSPRTPASASKIPSFARQIGRSVSTKIPTPPTSAKVNGTAKALSADRTGRNLRTYNRSTSADSREPAKKIQPSSSTQSLKNESRTPPNGAMRKATGIPSPARRSNNNFTSPPAAPPAGAKKQVTSKIASLWKRVEESKAKQLPGQDKRVWIQNEPPNTSKLIRSDTFEGKITDLPVNQA